MFFKKENKTFKQGTTRVYPHTLTRSFAFASPYEQCLRDLSDFLVSCAYADSWDRTPLDGDFEKARNLSREIYSYVTLQKHMQTQEALNKLIESPLATHLWLTEYDIGYAIKLAKYSFQHPDGFLLEEFHNIFPYKPKLEK